MQKGEKRKLKIQQQFFTSTLVLSVCFEAHVLIFVPSVATKTRDESKQRGSPLPFRFRVQSRNVKKKKLSSNTVLFLKIQAQRREEQSFAFIFHGTTFLVDFCCLLSVEIFFLSFFFNFSKLIFFFVFISTFSFNYID